MGFCIYNICKSKMIWAMKFTASRQIVWTTAVSIPDFVCCQTFTETNKTNNNFRIYLSNVLHSAPEQWPREKKLLHPKSIPTTQGYYCTLIFNIFEMFRRKLFEIKLQTGGKCLKMGQKFEKMRPNFFWGRKNVKK